MSYREREQQKMIRLFQDETGVFEFTMVQVAEWAQQRGFRMPKPPTSVELLARQLQQSARSETRTDPETGDQYRANHAYPRNVKGKPTMFWFDLDGPAATKSKAEKALKLRRNQALNDVFHIALDQGRWNRTHGPEEQIELDFDFGDEVTWRLNAPKKGSEQKMAG